MDKTLIQEFDALAVKTRSRANSIQTRLTALLHDAIESNVDMLKVNASELNVEKIHIQTLYNALRKNAINVERGKTFVVKNVDAYYFNEAIVKINA
jgi:hypothetical protein